MTKLIRVEKLFSYLDEKVYSSACVLFGDGLLKLRSKVL